MKKSSITLAIALTATMLGIAAPRAEAGGRDHWESHDRHRDHRDYRDDYRHSHHRHHHDRGWERHYRPAYVYEAPVVYEPAYIAPPPPVVYRQAYPVYRPEPGITIGIGIPPIVIPLR